MKAVLGEIFVNKNTSSFGFHMEQSLKNRKTYVTKE